ncbi:MAG: hypothetical protein QW701_01570 [Candidatus Nezhaarchaeales archaeon]
MIRDLSYMLLYSNKMEDYSTLSRALLAFSTVILLLITRWLSQDVIYEGARLSLIILFELYLASKVRGMRGILAGLKLVLLFTVIGVVVLLISHLAGWLAPDLQTLLPGALRLVAFFLGFSLIFQLISLREWRSIMNALGMKRQAVALSMVLFQIPTIIHYLSEAATALKLKYKGKKPYKIVVPLTLLSFLTSRSLLETYVLYGVPADAKFTLYKSKDVHLYLPFILLILGIILLPFLH